MSYSSCAAHPLDQDQAIAQAWGQASWADHSGVSRTLSALKMEAAQQIVAALSQVSQLFIDQEVLLAMRAHGKLVYDGDLTGRPVSNTSTTYPDVAYGPMSNAIHLGYQAALVSFHSPTYGRQWVSVAQHPGNTLACSQAETMVRSAEATTKVRPRRRTELLRERLAQEKVRQEHWRAQIEPAEHKLLQAQNVLQETRDQLAAWQAQKVAAATIWTQVGSNAEMPAWADLEIQDFLYPLDVALEHFHTGETSHYGALIHHGEDSVTEDLPGWFGTHNARQTIEAGIKEGKGVFQMHHLKVRSAPALYLQEHFAVFAANFVRWAAHWLATQCPQAPALPGVKTQVQVLAHTSAYVEWHVQGCLLRFSDHTLFVGRSLNVIHQWAHQLVLPLFKSCVFSPGIRQRIAPRLMQRY